ncbi:MAG: NADPH:quinone reductase-like Zn-dependent oxidoreductase [Candidatus Poriferisodalaceae bacterium]|jgi:NADPH:quinone reductase-like Zn-dependent oxidoreductase
MSADPVDTTTIWTGGFAQFCRVDDREAFTIDSDLTDVELASFPCAYSTAERMLDKIALEAGERVLITGTSGGVGSAAIQLAKRRGVEVVAVASSSKWGALKPFGPNLLLDRTADLVAELGTKSVDVVADVVAGPK